MLRVLGALLMVPGVGWTIGLGDWRAAACLLAAAALIVPLHWRSPAPGWFNGFGAEKAVLCLLLFSVAAISAGITGGVRRNTPGATGSASAAAPHRGILPGRMSATSASGDGATASGRGWAEPMPDQVQVEADYRRAQAWAASCDQESRPVMAEGGPAGQPGLPPSAIADAVHACQQSWSAFNDIYTSELAQNRTDAVEQGLLSCMDTYFARWKVSDRLMGALQSGRPVTNDAELDGARQRAAATGNACRQFLEQDRLRVAARS